MNLNVNISNYSSLKNVNLQAEIPPTIAGIMRFINHKVIDVAIIEIGLSTKLIRKKAATLLRNPKSTKAILIGLIVCTKNMDATKIIA